MCDPHEEVGHGEHAEADLSAGDAAQQAAQGENPEASTDGE